MKFFAMVLRNARRNPIRSLLTIGSLSVSLFLSMILVAYTTINGEVAKSTRGKNRIVVMGSQGFTQSMPYARIADISAMSGVGSVTQFAWYGGKYNNETMPFAQFSVEPATFFSVFDELAIPPDQLKAWQADKAGCIVGRKLAEDRKLKLGDPVPLSDGIGGVNLNLTLRGIYNGPTNSDLRACYFHWSFLDEQLKKAKSATAGNAGIIMVRCEDQARMGSLSSEIDKKYSSSDVQTKTQTEEAFANMFAEMAGGLQWIIISIGLAVGVSLLCVSANAMAMALRERTTEVAVLKAIGFGKPLIISLILSESVLIAAIGGLFGAIGCKLFCDVVDISRYSAGMLPFFFVPWSTAIGGMVVALGVGVFSGLFPAIRASNLSVVNGLRKVV